jgi:hypothetical protein
MRLPRNFLLTSWHAKFLKTAILYNVVVFSIFFFVYNLLDFDTHFTADQPVTGRGKLYFAIMAHTSGGANDIVPATDLARMLTGLHVILAWMQLMLVFVQ